MRAFSCGTCGQLVFIDNDACLRCGSPLAYRPSTRTVEVIGPATAQPWARRRGATPAPADAVRCGNHTAIGCTWLVEDAGPLCEGCRTTRTRPPDGDADAVAAWGQAEAAKRLLLFQAAELGLDLSGLVFDLPSGTHEPVTTGHADGVITIDVDEADDVARVRMRERMGEAYRTVLGHFRHEVGHYLWMTMVDQPGHHDAFRAAFGDERADYAAALEAHYASPTPAGWQDAHVSEYATAHPWEDFAETLAHYLHIRDVLQTAAAFGLSVDGAHPVLDADPEVVDTEPAHVQPLIDAWLPLTYALNAVNRAMGMAPLYPFVLAPAVIAKLEWVHRLVEGLPLPGSGGAPAPGGA